MGTLGIVETLFVVASIITAVTVITVFANKTFKILRKFVRFLDDFNGVEERPGQDHRPGFPERIKDLESCVNLMSEKMDAVSTTSQKIHNIEFKLMSIEKEMYPNHGSSMRDQVDNIVKRLNDVEKKIMDHVSK